jgi:hypothetical protein
MGDPHWSIRTDGRRQRSDIGAKECGNERATIRLWLTEIELDWKEKLADQWRSGHHSDPPSIVGKPVTVTVASGTKRSHSSVSA